MASKKIAVLALSLVLLLALALPAGCGGSQNTQGTTAPAATEAAAATTAAAAETTAAAAETTAAAAETTEAAAEATTAATAAATTAAAAAETTAAAAETTAAAAGGNELNLAGVPLVAEKETIYITTQIIDGQPANDEIAFWEAIEAQTNVHVVWNDIIASAWSERRNILMSSNDIPHAFLGIANFGDNDLTNFGSAGRFIKIQDYIDPYMPNLKRHLDAHPEWRAYITALDGNIYASPNISEAAIFKSGSIPYINQKWLNQLGFSDLDLTKPIPVEQFKEILRAFKDGDPNGNGIADEIPFSMGENGIPLLEFGASFGVIDNGWHLFVENGKVLYSPTTEGYKAFIKWLNELWTEGLLDPETFTQDDGVLGAKLKSPERIVGYLVGWRNTAWNLSDDDDEYIVVPPLEGPAGAYWIEKPSVAINRGGFIVTTTCPNPELYLRWADNLYDDDNSIQANLNLLIGEHIQKNASGKFEEIRALDWNRDGELSLMPGNYARLSILTAENYERLLTFPPVYIQKHPIDIMYEPYFSKSMSLLPEALWLTTEDGQTSSIIRSELEPYVLDCYARWVTSGGIDAEWESYLNTLRGMRVDELVALYQDYYDRMPK